MKYRLRFLSCVFIFHLFSLTSVIILSIAPVPNKTTSSAGYNRRQNELRHFPLKGLFDVFLTSKGENIAFPPPSPACNVVPLFELPLEKRTNTPIKWRGQGRGVYSFVLWSYPIWVQCLNNFVGDCRLLHPPDGTVFDSSNQNNVPASCLHRQIPCSLYLAFLSGRDGHTSLALVFSSTTNRSLPFKAHACTGEISGGRFQANSFSRGKIPLKRQLFSR